MLDQVLRGTGNSSGVNKMRRVKRLRRLVLISVNALKMEATCPRKVL